jgi:hypothetical protein
MRVPGISSTIFAGALALATPVHAVETIVLPGSHSAASSAPGGIPSPADDGLKHSEELAEEEAVARSEEHWLTAPPDPDRHSVWIPTAEWAVALSLTIPLFLIDPAFVNTGKFSGDHFADAWTDPPEWDGDGVVANYVLHPIMGAEAYLTLRNRDYGPWESFLFATGVSVAWEYLFEAWVEQPSGQDLLVTSPLGALLGECRFQMKRGVATWNPSLGRSALLIVLDPIEAIHRGIGEFRKDDDTEETMSSSLNFGPGEAQFMVTMRF